MTELVQAAAGIQTFIEERRWRFCFIGGLALLRWGEPRFTADIDLTLFTGFGLEEPFIDALLERFPARRPDMKAFSLRARVLLLTAPNGVPMDIALGGLRYEEQAITRSSLFEYADGVSLRTCSAEDLIVTKAFADRSRDWEDIRGVVIRQAGRLDWEYVHQNLAPLAELKEAPHIPQKLQAIRSELGD